MMTSEGICRRCSVIRVNALCRLYDEAFKDQDERSKEQLQSLEPEYLSLVKKFSSEARAFSALGGFYAGLGHKYLDKALAAAEKAAELDPENVVYAINTANLYYQRFSIYGQKSDVDSAIKIARNALTLPDAMDKPSPRQVANRMNRISLYIFLATS